MKKYLIFFLLVCTFTVFANSPVRTISSTATHSIGAGNIDTTVVGTITLTGDSVGLCVEYDQDSCSGSLRYVPLSPTGYTTNISFTSYTTALTITANNKTGYSSPIAHTAGVYQVRLYVLTKNEKATTQTIVTKVHQITWR